ncbi:hypothetical protein F2Q68_00006129 [Brassica cretica]|uniref:RIN4 pathogenic type III effector avirulence factor Avr cleavage site domain-containing protein n=1 Tax=Brassica cretica TaxID=69181 RepID=A0A8S9JGC1_BRACR|nr:hypothetical protein F2Q68_00006129 [Brassica cretica]
MASNSEARPHQIVKQDLKFGEWYESDPATVEGFTVIFSKAGEDKKRVGALAKQLHSGTGNTAVLNQRPRYGSVFTFSWRRGKG